MVIVTGPIAFCGFKQCIGYRIGVTARYFNNADSPATEWRGDSGDG
jgi:hypothetical protein